jgi:thiosulfate/3-mercaptopyruvate sulfurtransferase
MNTPRATGESAVVDVGWVAGHLSDEGLRVIEVDVSPAAYRQGHITGALLWNIYADLRRPDYSPISTAELEALLSRTGLSPDDTVVFYGYGAHLGYWLLRSLGHRRLLLLDGPREQWLETGRPWSVEEREARPAVYARLRRNPSLDVSRQAVQAMAGRPDGVVLDVRARAEYDGERFWPSGATEDTGRPGHIPDSVHLPIEALRDPDGHFRDGEEMREALVAAGVTPDRRVVTYCTVGNRAAQAWFALSQLLGYPDTGVYAGSWAEWGFLADTPVESSENVRATEPRAIDAA